MTNILGISITLVLISFYLDKVFAATKLLPIDDEENFEPLNYYDDEVRAAVIENMQSTNNEKKLAGIGLARIFLSMESDAPFADFIDDGIILILIKSLNSTNVKIQGEAISTLSTIAAHSQKYAQEVVDEGALPYFMKLIHSSDADVTIKALKGISSIMNDNIKMRDYMLKLAIVENLYKFIEPKTSKEVLRRVVGVIKIICANDETDPLPEETIKALLPALSNLIRHPDVEIANIALWSIVAITEGNHRKIDFNNLWIENLVKLMNHKSAKVQAGAVAVLCNIIIRNDSTSAVKLAYDNGILKHMPEMLMHESEVVLEDSLKILEKLMASSEEYASKIFEADLIPLVIYHLSRSSTDIKNQAARTIFYASWKGTSPQISSMLDMNVICLLCRLLLKAENENDTVRSIITIYHNIIEKAESRMNEIFDQLSRCGCMEKIKHLGEHNDKDIKKGANDIADLSSCEDTDTCSKPIHQNSQNSF